MSYSSSKGYDGEVQVADFLSKTFAYSNYQFMRVGGPERAKKVFAGDVVINPSTSKDRGEGCILKDYFIEVKKQGHINFWADTDKARDDAKWAGKRGYILFAILSERGVHTGVAPKRLVAMDWSTFASIIEELQGYRDAEQSK
jgi:hypothetical protein